MTTHLRFAVLAVAAMGMAAAMTSSSVEAASNLNSSRSNIYKITNADDEAACKTAGGKVETKDGQKVCSVPFAGGALAQ